MIVAWLQEKLEIAHGRRQTYRSMEGLRGVAILLVFFCHYFISAHPWIATRTIADIGVTGVDLFFVLSGFLIYGAVIQPTSFSVLGYAKNRIRRIYPTFLAVLFLNLIIWQVVPGQSRLPSAFSSIVKYLIANVLLLPAPFIPGGPIIDVAWSLSYEVFYYCLVPILVFTSGMRRWQSDRRIYFWVGTAIIGFCVSYSSHGVLTRILMFIAGILLFKLYQNKSWCPVHGGGMLFGTVVLLFGVRGFIPVTINAAILYVIPFIFLLYFVASSLNPLSLCYKWLSSTPLRWLGNMSYSFYLLHKLSIEFSFSLLEKFYPPQLSQTNMIFLGFWLPILFFAICSSFVLFLFVERPFSIVPRGRLPQQYVRLDLTGTRMISEEDNLREK